ncbi:hypothetical protein D3C80_1585970 [compost metagenome]
MQLPGVEDERARARHVLGKPPGKLAYLGIDGRKLHAAWGIEQGTVQGEVVTVPAQGRLLVRVQMLANGAVGQALIQRLQGRVGHLLLEALKHGTVQLFNQFDPWRTLVHQR